jgi:hypothetical protein
MIAMMPGGLAIKLLEGPCEIPPPQDEPAILSDSDTLSIRSGTIMEEPKVKTAPSKRLATKTKTKSSRKKKKKTRKTKKSKKNETSSGPEANVFGRTFRLKQVVTPGSVNVDQIVATYSLFETMCDLRSRSFEVWHSHASQLLHSAAAAATSQLCVGIAEQYAEQIGKDFGTEGLLRRCTQDRHPWRVEECGKRGLLGSESCL